MTDIQFIAKEIECDKENIQTLIDMLGNRTLTKGNRRSIEALIKRNVKNIHNQKCLIDEKMFETQAKLNIPLFEVEPSPLKAIEIYKEIDSFFGKI